MLSLKWNEVLKAAKKNGAMANNQYASQKKICPGYTSTSSNSNGNMMLNLSGIRREY
jgi:hypothetical protein